MTRHPRTWSEYCENSFYDEDLDFGPSDMCEPTAHPVPERGVDTSLRTTRDATEAPAHVAPSPLEREPRDPSAPAGPNLAPLWACHCGRSTLTRNRVPYCPGGKGLGGCMDPDLYETEKEGAVVATNDAAPLAA